MKRKIVTAVIAFILCAAVVPPAGIYSVMAENAGYDSGRGRS